MSGKKVVLLGDLGTDHEGFPPTPVISGSPNVFIDGKPVARVGDQLAPHSKPKHPPHPRTITSGSSTVFINGMPVAVTGGEISCGGVTIGSGTVIVGDTHTPAPFSGSSPKPRRRPAAGEDPHEAGAMEAWGDNSMHASAAAPTNHSESRYDGAGLTPTRRADPKLPELPRTHVGPHKQRASHADAAVAPNASTQGVQKEPSVVTTEPGFHVVRQPMSKTVLLTALYGDASAKPDHFDRLNPGLGNQVLPGEMIVLGDPQSMECTREEADLMQVAARVNAKVRSLDQDEAQFIVDHYDLLETITSTSSAGLGAGAVMVSKQIDSIKATLTDLERLHQESYRKHGHLNHPEFFEKRLGLFKRLNFALGNLARKGMSLDDDAKLKRALGLSSKSIVHHWKHAGVGDIPGYASHYERLEVGARYMRYTGYLALGLDISSSIMKVREVCTVGNDGSCEKVIFKESGRMAIGTAGGALGASAATACGLLGFATSGVGAIACAVIVGGAGAATGGYIGGSAGEQLGERIHEVTIDD